MGSLVVCSALMVLCCSYISMTEAFTPYRKLGEPTKPGWPVVLVPGDGGSQIEAKLVGKPEVVHYVCQKVTQDYFDLWLNLELFLPYVIDCWVDNMKLFFNETTNKTENSPGVVTRVPGWGNTSTVEWLDPSKSSSGLYYTTLVEKMVTLGYRRGKDVVGAPYDWRHGPGQFDNYFDKLKELIENTYRYNGNKKVVVVGHSMGNPVMLYFYNSLVTQEWKDKFIRSHVSMAGAWGGSLKIMKLFASGYNMGHYRIVLPPSKLRTMQRSFGSSAFLMPSYNLWDRSEVLASSPERNYTLANLEQFFTDINFEDGYRMYKQNAFMLGNLSGPGVEVHCIYSLGMDTPERFEWSKGYFPDYPPTTIHFGEGDGTVNQRSLETCLKWAENNNNKPVTKYVLNKVEHLDILNNAEAISYVQKALYQDLK
uniref:Uncharacterized protein n=1 Tax=Plectus sambesii TaxID=2011161 RepID=A0A914VNE4_9BILA